LEDTVTKIIPTAPLQSLVVLALGAFSGLGATIEFIPSSATATVGASLGIDVVISGLGAGVLPSVSAFDLTVEFDSSVLSATGVTFGALLGDPSTLEAITASTISPGSVNFAEVSLLLPSALDALQPASFSLASLTLQAVGPGTSTLGFVPGTVPGVPGLDISDAFGDLLSLTASDGAVDVAVPEPTAVLLILRGTALVPVMARRRGRGLKH
jgi:hypothetical protein